MKVQSEELDENSMLASLFIIDENAFELLRNLLKKSKYLRVCLSWSLGELEAS